MSELEYPAYESSEVSAREVIQLLRRRRWTVLGTFILFLLAAAVLTPMMTPIYRARATMLIEEASQASSSSPDDKNPDKSMLGPTEPLPLDTQVEVLQSGPLWHKVLDRISPFSPQAYPTLTVAQRSKTNVIEVTAESTDPRVARDVPNLLIQEYIKE